MTARDILGIRGPGRRALLAAVPLGASASPVLAQGFPARPIQLVVAYAPGGATDLVARVLARDLAGLLGQPVTVDNRPGGGTLIGTQHVQRALPDGHTLLFGTNALVNNSVMASPPPYDAVTGFTPVGLVSTQPLFAMVHPGLDVTTIQEFIALARARPGALNFASSGNGSGQHIAGEEFRVQARLDIAHVPYRGAGPAVSDLIAGRVDIMFTSLFGLTDHVAAGRLRILASTGRQRSAATPGVPTIAEAALPGYEHTSWQAVFAPPGLPPDIQARLNRAIQDIGARPAFAEALAAQALEVATGAPGDLARLVASERDAIAAIIRRTGIRIE